MRIPSVHPFPARMAPELALGPLEDLAPGSLVLDPMAGSGTVLRHALQLGHRAVGFDMDPLAVLISRVWTTRVEDSAVERQLRRVLSIARAVDLRTTAVPGHDHETREFVKFWFGVPQRRALSRLAVALARAREDAPAARDAAAFDLLAVALSRIIVTKEQCASLARDTSHSRPHRVAESSQYDVMKNFERSVESLRRRLEAQPQPVGCAKISEGDARSIPLEDGVADAVITSPPYLNAIDYMRGHRLSLVWLGHSLDKLRAIRAASIGSERGAEEHGDRDVSAVSDAMCPRARVDARQARMVLRYAGDLLKLMKELRRVLREDGTALLVVGNSCLRGVFVNSAQGVGRAAELAGLALVAVSNRELPQQRRYLPVTKSGSLAMRMRSETVMTFRRTIA